mgnify:CR=1 FL=1
MSNKLEIAVRLSERRERTHEQFLKQLASDSFSGLFSQLGIENYKIVRSFKEPHLKSEEGPSPDFVFLYLHNGWNLLLVELKGRHTTNSLRTLDNDIEGIKGYVASDTDRSRLYRLLGEEVPVKVLQSCRMRVAGVYMTKQKNLRVHRVEDI